MASSGYEDVEVREYDLVGRMIEIYWEDGKLYDALVVAYSAHVRKHRIVYVDTDEVETIRLDEVRYRLYERIITWRRTLVCRIVEFRRNRNADNARAIVYKEEKEGEKLYVAYLHAPKTDRIAGGGWEFRTLSPCLKDDLGARVEIRTKAWSAKECDEDNGAGFESTT